MVKGNRVKVKSEKDLKELRRELEEKRRLIDLKKKTVIKQVEMMKAPWYQPKISLNWCSLVFFGGLGGSLLICWLIQ